MLQMHRRAVANIEVDVVMEVSSSQQPKTAQLSRIVLENPFVKIHTLITAWYEMRKHCKCKQRR
jgi:hypothetical protein